MARGPGQWLEDWGRSHPLWIFAAALCFVGFVAALDRLTAYEATFTILYLGPVLLVAWVLGGPWTLLVSASAALAWLAADVDAVHRYGRRWYLAWNTFLLFGLFLVAAHLLVLLRRSLRREQELARVDYVTGVANPRRFYEIAELEIHRARRHSTPLPMAFMDLDHFKDVNDQLGHHVGDTVLQTVGAELRRNTRGTDTVGRLGGDEFGLLLPETGREAAEEVLHKLRERVLSAMRAQRWPVTFSMGAVVHLTPPPSVQEMIRNADRLMYSVKESGKNRTEVVEFNGPAADVLRQSRRATDGQ